MNERQIPRWAKAAVALIVLFGLGSLLYNSGYSSGMVTGLLVSSGEGATMNPYLLAHTGGLHGGVGFFGGLLRVGFFLFVLAMIGRFFGFWRWKMHGKCSGEGTEHGSQHAFSPHIRGMWEAHRTWHQAEQQAEQPAQPAPVQPAAPAETQKAAAATEPPMEGK